MADNTASVAAHLRQVQRRTREPLLTAGGPVCITCVAIIGIQTGRRGGHDTKDFQFRKGWRWRRKEHCPLNKEMFMNRLYFCAFAKKAHSRHRSLAPLNPGFQFKQEQPARVLTVLHCARTRTPASASHRCDVHHPEAASTCGNLHSSRVSSGLGRLASCTGP